MPQMSLLLHSSGLIADLKFEEEATALVLVVRYSAQLLRLGVLIKNYRRQMHKRLLNVHLNLAMEADNDYEDQFSPRSAEEPSSPVWGVSMPEAGFRGGRGRVAPRERLRDAVDDDSVYENEGAVESTTRRSGEGPFVEGQGKEGGEEGGGVGVGQGGG